ncbi:hypothetical protein FQN53_003773, partial [Emmonsiellopsis sp. PD_33]
NIDPAILDEGTLVSLNLAQADIDSLESAILPDASEAHTANADEEDQLSFNVGTGVYPHMPLKKCWRRPDRFCLVQMGMKALWSVQLIPMLSGLMDTPSTML